MFTNCLPKAIGKRIVRIGLIRATHDRRVLDEACLSEALAHAPVMGEIGFDLPASHKRRKKRVTQTLKATRVELQPPQRYGDSLEPVEITVVLAQETRPPKGEEPVTWILLTNLPVTTIDQAIEKIGWYLCRWQIEIYFRILKSGCKLEKLQLEHIERLRPALGVIHDSSVACALSHCDGPGVSAAALRCGV